MNWHPLWVVAQSPASAAALIAEALVRNGQAMREAREAEALLQSLLEYGLVCVTGSLPNPDPVRLWYNAVIALAETIPLDNQLKGKLLLLGYTTVQVASSSLPPAAGDHPLFSPALLAQPRGYFLPPESALELLAIPARMATEIRLVDRYFLSPPYPDSLLFDRFVDRVICQRDPDPSPHSQIFPKLS